MRLSTPNAFFCLTLLGYASSEALGDPLEDNWLNVRADIATPEGAWSVVDPCLLYDEASRLADWLESIAQGKGNPAISFLEPMLLFRRAEVNGQAALRIHFGPLVTPDWQERIPATRPDRSVTFLLRDVDLPAEALRLHKQIRGLRRTKQF